MELVWVGSSSGLSYCSQRWFSSSELGPWWRNVRFSSNFPTNFPMVNNFISSSSALYACVAGYHHISDHCRIFIMASSWRNQDGTQQIWKFRFQKFLIAFVIVSHRKIHQKFNLSDWSSSPQQFYCLLIWFTSSTKWILSRCSQKSRPTSSMRRTFLKL